MSHIIQINNETEWLGASWAAEHVCRLLLRFLPSTAPSHFTQLLTALEEGRELTLDLSQLSTTDFAFLANAGNVTMSALRKAGPRSELFRDPDFYPGFVDRFQDFVDKMNNDPRNR